MTLTNEHAKNGPDETIQRVGEMASRAGRQAQKFAEKLHLGARADQIAADVEHRAVKAYETVKTGVQDRPTMAIGVAAGVGVLIGLMLSRR